MESHDKILEVFGKSLIEGFDSQFGSLMDVLNGDSKKFLRLKQITALLGRFDEEEKKIIQQYFFNLFSGILHDTLRIFEENERFKLIYEENGSQVNLAEISEMLKAEPIIENGWIQRFSKYSEKNKK